MYRDKGRRPAKEYGSFRAMVWVVGSTPPPTSGYPGAFGVIKPSRPVTVCAAESSAYLTHAVPQKRHISGTFETVVGPPPLGQATTGGGCKIKIWLLYVVLLMQSGLVSIWSRYTRHTLSMGTPYLPPHHLTLIRGVSCLTYQKLKSLSRPFICSNSGHSLSDKSRHYLLFWLFNKEQAQ